MFCKVEDGNLLTALSYVKAPEYQLLVEDKDTYEYPVDGWYWFETEEEAREFFNLPEDENPGDGPLIIE